MVQFYVVFYTCFLCFLCFFGNKKAVKMFSPLQNVDLLLFNRFRRLDCHRPRACRRRLDCRRCRWFSIF